MYINPTLFRGGAFFLIHASTHCMALRSAHIGSGPGVFGLSAIHVKLLVPFRTTRIFPSAPMSITVASLLIVGGAADVALFIISSSVILAEGMVCCWAIAGATNKTPNPPMTMPTIEKLLMTEL